MKKYKVLIDSTVFTVFIIEGDNSSLFCSGRIDLLNQTIAILIQTSLIKSNDKISIEFQKE